jgi:hypothetical protein
MDKIKDFLLSLLTWIGESPFRLFAVILLCVLGLSGWIVYSEKDAFMASYRAQQALPKMNGHYEAASNFITKNSTAELVAIFEVNTLLNTRKLAYLSTRTTGHNKEHNGYDVGLFTKNHSNNTDVVSLMSGSAPCSPYLKPQSYLGFVYREAGVKFMCRISVPAEPGVFIGQISVGWKDNVEDVEIAQTVLNIASNMLYTVKN